MCSTLNDTRSQGPFQAQVTWLCTIDALFRALDAILLRTIQIDWRSHFPEVPGLDPLQLHISRFGNILNYSTHCPFSWLDPTMDWEALRDLHRNRTYRWAAIAGSADCEQIFPVRITPNINLLGILWQRASGAPRSVSLKPPQNVCYVV
jgi:hypothetical protein